MQLSAAPSALLLARDHAAALVARRLSPAVAAHLADTTSAYSLRDEADALFALDLPADALTAVSDLGIAARAAIYGGAR